MWTIRAKDKFGDYGIIGILSLSIKKNSAYLVDFILSCRVVGRNIEEIMIEFTKEYCRKNKIKNINGKFMKTEKNSLCFKFFNKLNLIDSKKHSFVIQSAQNKFDFSNITVLKPSFR